PRPLREPLPSLPAPMSAHKFEVVVGNIGATYSGPLMKEALKTFKEYKSQSQQNYGRAGNESVTLFKDGEPWREHAGTPNPY
ncbi:hypothetical protein, partial [Limosilactobacillus reuteri]|uniref:hypothetical protein n=1 Tax=Limosilactobacillus reuteri TaxID=1598 RepID=UPI00207CF5BD